MPDPSTIFTSVFVLVWTIGLLLGMTYLRGGGEAVRRVAPRLAIIVPVVVLILLVETTVMDSVGSLTVGVVLLPVGLLILVVRMRRLRQLEVTARAAGRAPVFTPAIRRFVVVGIAVLVIGSILVSFLASRAGY